MLQSVWETFLKYELEEVKRRSTWLLMCKMLTNEKYSLKSRRDLMSHEWNFNLLVFLNPFKPYDSNTARSFINYFYSSSGFFQTDLFCIRSNSISTIVQRASTPQKFLIAFNELWKYCQLRWMRRNGFPSRNNKHPNWLWFVVISDA